MATPDPAEPSDDVLLNYIREVLERIGEDFAEPDVLEEALTAHRDLWANLYRLDRG